MIRYIMYLSNINQYEACAIIIIIIIIIAIIAIIIITRQVTSATHARNRVCPRVELILKIIIILLIIFLGFIKSKPC